MDFQPNYRNIVDAACNKPARRLPLYEHDISLEVIEKIGNQRFRELLAGDFQDKKHYFSLLCGFYRDHGYDTVSFEGCITEVIQGGKGLMGQGGALIRRRADLERFPWEKTAERYFARFRDSFLALTAALPAGMKAVGGVGNGIFECIQDFVPLTELAFLQIDDPDLYRDLWLGVASLVESIWTRFLEEFSSSYALCRMGDDLGFQGATLINPEEIRSHIIPAYRRIIRRVHGTGKPFLLHSCGRISSIMEDLIETAGIDAKHSNEDNIAPFRYWVEQWGHRIGNFGGVDMNILCLGTGEEVATYVGELLRFLDGHPGIAVGSGNQIADYVKPENFLTMVETVRRHRGD